MNYTKGEWAVSDSAFTRCTSYKGKKTGDRKFVTIQDNSDKFLEEIAEAQGDTQEEAEANARLITAAVNGCISVNPDNPQAVGEAIKEMYEALQDVLYYFNHKEGDYHQRNEVTAAITKALAKAESTEAK